MNDKLEQINKEIADLEERRQELRKAQSRARATVTEQEAVLYGALIDGGVADEPLETVSRESARVEAIDKAEKQLDSQLATLQAEREKIEREIAIANCEQAFADIEKTLKVCIGYQYKFNAALGSIQLPEVPRGYTLSPGAQLTRNILGQLGELDVRRWLIDKEYRAPDFMAQARKQERIK